MRVKSVSMINFTESWERALIRQTVVRDCFLLVPKRNHRLCFHRNSVDVFRLTNSRAFLMSRLSQKSGLIYLTYSLYQRPCRDGAVDSVLPWCSTQVRTQLLLYKYNNFSKSLPRCNYIRDTPSLTSKMQVGVMVKIGLAKNKFNVFMFVGPGPITPFRIKSRQQIMVPFCSNHNGQWKR